MTLEANKIYNLKDNGSAKQERGLAFATAQYTATLGKSFTAPQVSGVTEGVEYTSSDEAIAAVDPTSGAVTLKKAGTVTITAAAAESRYYLAGEASYTLTISKQARNLKFSASTAEGVVGEDLTEPTLSGVLGGVVYESSNTSVATVAKSAGVVTMIAAGTTVITAKAGETDVYLAGEASYTLTVKEHAVIRINNKNGWGDLNITIKQGSTTIVDAKPMVDEGNNIFAYSLDPQYIGKEVTYFIGHSWYTTSTKTTTLKADSKAEAIVLNTTYLQPNDWNSDNPRYGAHIWVSGKSGIWVNATRVKDNFYEVEVPANGNYTNIIWCRMNPSNSTNEWASVWIQTGDLTLQHKCYCIQGKDAWNKPTGNYWY